MSGLFYKKSISILLVAAAVVLILLLCILLTYLTQLSSIKQARAEFDELLNEARANEEAKQELLNYRNTDKYVIEWAIRMNLIPDDVINYIASELAK